MDHGCHWLLIAGASLSASAAIVHLCCIAFGPSWYRAFGAGERMVQMAAAKQWRPTVITLAIASMLFAWAAYALSGAGVLPRLPLLRTVLCAITTVYLLRGLAFVPMRKWLPGNSTTFWWWSSAICLFIGVVHLLGLHQAWSRL